MKKLIGLAVIVLMFCIFGVLSLNFAKADDTDNFTESIFYRDISGNIYSYNKLCVQCQPGQVGSNRRSLIIKKFDSNLRYISQVNIRSDIFKSQVNSEEIDYFPIGVSSNGNIWLYSYYHNAVGIGATNFLIEVNPNTLLQTKRVEVETNMEILRAMERTSGGGIGINGNYIYTKIQETI